MWATNVWWLVPAFIVQGLVSAGADLGVINAGIQLAPPDRVDEYSAIQSTIMGLRGMVGPMLGIALLGLGASPAAIFALGAIFMLVSAFIVHTIVRSRPANRPRRWLRPPYAKS
jgi:MFS family permease